MLGQNLRQLYESLGPVDCLERLAGLLESKEVKPEDFSLRELAESFCGHDWVSKLNTHNLGRFSTVSVMEAGEGVDVSAFSNITGQILYTKIMDGWKQATANVDRLAETVKTQFDGEKIPFLGQIPDEGLKVRPGMPYPEAGFGERFVETPSTDKYGQIVSITKEMVFFDRTSQALKRANSNGERLGVAKSKRIWDGVLGYTNTYKFNGTTYNTYATSGGWINKKSATPLVDYTSIEQAYILAAAVLDPDSNNPIDIEFKQLVVMPAKLFTARRIIGATEISSTYPGYQATVTPPGNVQMVGSNPLPDSLDIIYSKIAYQRILNQGVSATNANDYWFVGDFAKAFAYMENWPITVVQAPPNSLKEFEQDIIVRVKASERGVFAVQDPRFVFQFYNS